MARFLLLPKDDDVPDALAGGDLSLSPQARAAKVKSLTTFRRAHADPRLSSGRGLRAVANVKVIATPQRHTPITGVTIFEGTAEDAEKIQEAAPGAEMVEDFRLDLISPVRSGNGEALAGDAAAAGIAIDAADLDNWHLETIGLLKARAARFGLTGTGATIAVMDTGVAEHRELQGKIVDNIVFDVEQWIANSVPPADTDFITPGHGTHVGGIIAGTNVGVAPGARLASYSMIPNTIGSLSHFVFAMEHVQTRPEIQIINMSAGKRETVNRMRYLAQMAQRTDTLFVVAVGNEGPNTSRCPGNYPEVFSVAASDRTDKVWGGGGMGTVMWGVQARVVPDIMAPGVDIWSCHPRGGYQCLTGTSMATPVVSGIAALMIEKWPDITRPQLIGELMEATNALNLAEPLQATGRIKLPQRLHAP
ncbi:S8 family serine peptidase [Mesorhizobium sp.]|uniref:S8 family peptidase n=1 Tax=Mesorhizobium sp. TaxID=1871066 RepID=UPI001207A261|nr:S8 family serine peptidase [Mesorhizobium sp.]TIN74405.1 MAG: hypothetical protein E5Y09_33010 [Mesorhizobium sp.]